MIYFLLFSLLIFVGYGIGFVGKKHCLVQWMDKNFTTAIKGFSILTVVWAHFGAEFDIGGIQFVAGIGVALFLICSGYGLQISYEKNGLKDFWKKRFLRVCIPFWIVETIGLLVMGEWTIQEWFYHILFVKANWYLGYIVICYILFWIIKKLSSKIKVNETVLLLVAFGIWFVIDSLWFANSDMPFLRARQMLSFPIGIILAKYAPKVKEILANPKIVIKVLCSGLILGMLFMGITQIQIVKNLPYLLSNTLSLLTVLPLAIGLLLLGKLFPKLLENHGLYWCGIISYELFLIHTYTLKVVTTSIFSIAVFIVLTVLLAVLLYVIIGKGFSYGRLNRSHSNKK